MWSRVSKPKNLITPLNALFSDDIKKKNHENYDDSEIVVSKFRQLQAREGKKNVVTKKSVQGVETRKRNLAERLHRQADLLHHRGDYELALYLYHRAASLYPRELRHSAATRRTAAAIISAINSTKAPSRKSLPGAQDICHVAANFCPETAALMAKKIVEESRNPVSSIKQILDYIDSRKDFWQEPPVFQYRRRTIGGFTSRPKEMLKQSRALEGNTLKDLQAAFASGDLNKSREIGLEVLAISEGFSDRRRYHYQVAAHHYLAMIEMSAGRHDRAVDKVSRMVRLARSSGDLVLWSRSMMTLGKVHLSFGHLEAAARAWERLVLDVEEAIPKAWLLHEIGRCYFEMKVYAKALEMAARCIEYAHEGNSQKWLMHGKLLSGQSLVELGRYGEAVGSLTVASRVAATVGPQDDNHKTSQYLSDLINRLFVALRIAVYPRDFVTSNSANCARPINGVVAESRNSKDQVPLESIPTRQTYSPSESSITISGRSESMEQSTSDSGQGPRKNIETFHLGIEKKDIERLTSCATLGVRVAEPRFPPHVDHQLSSLRSGDIDETGQSDRMPTHRTRIISNETTTTTHHQAGNSTDNFDSLDDAPKILNDVQQTCHLDDRHSSFTGKTYVLD